MDDSTLSVTVTDVPRVALDTSVLISYERHWLWSMAQLGVFEAVWSAFIVGEMVRVRVESSIARDTARSVYRRRVNLLVHRLSDVLTIADYRSILLDGALSDPDDDPILATALAAGAQFVVSNDVKHFPPGATIMHVRFVTPADFLILLDELYPDANLREQAGTIGKHLP